MRWCRGGAFLLATLLQRPAPVTAHADQTQFYPDVRDRELVELAQKAVIERCAGGFQGMIPEGGREDLEGALAEERFLIAALSNATGPQDAARQVTQHMRTEFLIQKSAPLAIGIMLFFLYWCFCWSLCPWATCCERCCFDKGTSPRCVFCVYVTLIACATGVFLAALATRPGYDQCAAGFENSACSTAKMLSVTLAGQAESPSFVGLVSMEETLWRLEDALESDSPLMLGVTGVLAETAEFEDALRVAVGVVGLFTSMVELPDNARPQTAANATLMHVCKLCQSVAAPARRITEHLSGGANTALVATRAGLRRFLSEDARSSLRQVLRSAREPITEFKSFVRGAASLFLQPGYFQTIQTLVDSQLWYATHFFLAYAAALLGASALATAIIGSARCKCCHKCARWLAGCTWECGCLFVIPMFIVGGLMMAVTPPLAGMCLMMEDMSSQMLYSISCGLGVNMSADRGVIVGDLVDRCLALANRSATAELLDITYGRRNGSEDKVFLGAALDSGLGAPLDDSFTRLGAALERQIDSAAATASAAAVLRALLAHNPVDALMLPDGEMMRRDLVFGDLQPYLDVGYTTSSSCADFSVVGEMGELVNRTIPGLDHFRDRLLELGTATGNATPGCLQTVLCNRSLSPDRELACDAGNALVDLKAALMDPSARAFRCDLFGLPGGFVCDILNMTQAEGGSWSNDCLPLDGQGAGVLRVKERRCTLREFAVYLQEFDVRIEKAMARLDIATARAAAAIGGDLRESVYSHIVDGIVRLTDGSSCGYMPELYRETIDGLCYQGVWGLRFIGNSFVLSGSVISVMVVTMYLVWRTSLGSQHQRATIEASAV